MISISLFRSFSSPSSCSSRLQLRWEGGLEPSTGFRSSWEAECPGDWTCYEPQLMYPQIGWGTFTIGHAFIRGRSALIAMRLMIGAFEAGFCE
jgi:hypothetical protein